MSSTKLRVSGASRGPFWGALLPNQPCAQEPLLARPAPHQGRAPHPAGPPRRRQRTHCSGLGTDVLRPSPEMLLLGLLTTCGRGGRTCRQGDTAGTEWVAGGVGPAGREGVWGGSPTVTDVGRGESGWESLQARRGEARLPLCGVSGGQRGAVPRSVMPTLCLFGLWSHLGAQGHFQWCSGAHAVEPGIEPGSPGDRACGQPPERPPHFQAHMMVP